MKPKDEQKEDNVLFVGIDLGTSRSAICSSNGMREWIESYAGWPKDFIAEQVVGKPVLFGAEALQHRLSLDICRPLERGIIKEGIESSERAVKEIIRYLIDLARPETAQKIHAVIGVPADSLKVNKLAIRRAVAEYVHTLMVVSEPFAVAGMVLNDALIIDIGAGTSTSASCTERFPPKKTRGPFSPQATISMSNSSIISLRNTRIQSSTRTWCGSLRKNSVLCGRSTSRFT
jgi:rod shape-determining protein MreB